MKPAGAIRLRALRQADLAPLHQWYQTPELWRHLVGEFQARNEAEAVAYMRRWLTRSGDEVRLAIERLADGRLLGMTALTAMAAAPGEAEFHIFLGEATDRGQGHGRAATAAMLAYGFDRLGLAAVRLRVRADNLVARRLYAELGFVDGAGSKSATLEMRLSANGYRARQDLSTTR